MSEAKYLVQDNKIVIPGNKWFKERIVAEVTENNKDITIDFLIEKFDDLQKDANALILEYNAAADKPKLLGKISRFKNFAFNAKALGDYEALLSPFDEFEQAIQSIVEENIKQRTQLCEKIEALKLDARDWKIRTEELQELSKEFKQLALVPHPEIEEIRLRFEKAKDEFFASKQHHFDDQQSILLDNLAHKIEICEKAEALSNSTEWKKTSDAYNALLEEWKTVGPVPRHRSDELWLRFCQAKDVFFANKKENFENIKVQHEENLKIKLELIAEAESLKDSRDWKKTSDLYNQLMKKWKETGRVSDEKNDEVWNLFNAARDHFFKQKDAYYSGVKLNLDNNYAKKLAIVTRAEELAADCSDWDMGTSEILEMTEDWKKTGRIAKEHGDDLWNRFNDAKKAFFANKDAYRESRRKELSQHLSEKNKRNRGYAGKLNRELVLEQEVLNDFKERLTNLPASVRSFETKERYEKIIQETNEKINFLKKKIADIEQNSEKEEKELRQLNRFKGKKPEAQHTEAKTEDTAVNDTTQEVNTEVPKVQQDKPKENKPEFKAPKVKPIQQSPSIKSEVQEASWEDKLKALKNKFSE